MKDEEGNVKLLTTYGIHETVYTDLKSMAEMYGVQLGDGTISFGEQISHIDPINLLCSYLRHHTSSDRSTGEGTSSRSDSTPNRGVRRKSSTRTLRSSGRLESSSVLESLNEKEGE